MNATTMGAAVIRLEPLGDNQPFLIAHIRRVRAVLWHIRPRPGTCTSRSKVSVVSDLEPQPRRSVGNEYRAVSSSTVVQHLHQNPVHPALKLSPLAHRPNAHHCPPELTPALCLDTFRVMTTTQPVVPGSTRWKELVREGIIRDGNRNWFLGDSALEIAPMGDTNGNNGSEANLRRYADEIGVEYHSLLSYRQVAQAWPLNTRVSSTAWKVHQQLMGRKELILPGMTVTQAAAALGQQNVGRTGPQSDAPSRAAAVREYLADPEVARIALADEQTALSVVTAAPAQITRAQTERYRAIAAAPPASPTPPEVSRPTVLQIQSALIDIKRSFRDVFRMCEVAELTDTGKQNILEHLAEVETENERLRDFLTGMSLSETLDKIVGKDKRHA
jgi:hypothetical protein